MPHGNQPTRSTTQILVVTHQYGISALVSQTSFGGEASGSVAKCRLFSQATRSQAFKNSRAQVNVPLNEEIKTVSHNSYFRLSLPGLFNQARTRPWFCYCSAYSSAQVFSIVPSSTRFWLGFWKIVQVSVSDFQTSVSASLRFYHSSPLNDGTW